MVFPSSRRIIPGGEIPKKEAREEWYDKLPFVSLKKDILHIPDMIFIGQPWLDTII